MQRLLCCLIASAGAFAAPKTLARPARRQGRSAVRMAAVAPEDIVVMMNGLPGKMGYSVAEACVARGMALADVALTGAPFAGDVVEAAGASVTLQEGGSDAAEAAGAALVAKCKKEGKTLVAIDFTVPQAAVANAEFYARHGMSFVMGTTGADPQALSKSVLDGTHSAVIAPNMSKQIVAMQAVLEKAARDFPGAFAGYELKTIESHQKAKVDTSGTAKAVVASLVQLQDETVWSPENARVAAAVRDVEKVRDDAASMDGAGGRLGKVPAEHLPGHAYHTYSLTSGDGSVTFELRHNVNGRATYADGVADATLFLAAKLQEPGEPSRRLFDMIDVLKAGAMS